MSLRVSVKYGVLLMLLAIVALNGQAQCSLSLVSYPTNTAYPIKFTVSGDVSNQYTWSFGDGSPDTVTGMPVTQHLYADTGTYQVCIYGYDSNTLCRDTACQTINLPCSIAGSLSYQVNPQTGLVSLTVSVMGDGAIIAGDWIINTVNGVNVVNHTQLSDTFSRTLSGGQYIAAVVVASLPSGCSDTIFSDTITVSSSTVLCQVLQQRNPQGVDSYIRSDLPNVNFGLSPDIVTQQWAYHGFNSEARGLIKFDLSSIPAGSTLVSANLTLYADTTSSNSGNGYPGEPTYGQNNASVLQFITAPWQQLDVTWNNQPATSNNFNIPVPQSTSNAQNYTIDISLFASFWVQAPDSNFGMMLSMPNTFPFNNLIFCSSAHPDSALRPALNICFIPPANACNASFTYNNVGDSVHFYSQALGGDTVQWRFDDGDSSSLANPVHYFGSNGIHQTTLTVIDSAGGCSAVTPVNVNGIINDTLCGVVFFDVNNNLYYDAGDNPLSNFEVVIDGTSYLTDNTGFYHIPVGGGGHIVSVVIPQFSYSQTYPAAPSNYAISTTNGDYICGLDFAMGNGNATAIKNTYGTGAVSVTVYPNPASDHLLFRTSAIHVETNITVYDLYGQAIAKTIIKNGVQVSIDISQWADGLYVWKAVQGGSEVGMGKVEVVK